MLKSSSNTLSESNVFRDISYTARELSWKCIWKFEEDYRTCFEHKNISVKLILKFSKNVEKTTIFAKDTP